MSDNSERGERSERNETQRFGRDSYQRDRPQQGGDRSEQNFSPDSRMKSSRYRVFFKKKVCKFCVRKINIHFLDVDALRRFTTDRGKILPSRITGNCARHQRQLATAIKRARVLALLPFVAK